MHEEVESASDANSASKRQGILARLINLLGRLSIAGTLVGFAAQWSWIADAVIQFRVQFLILLIPAIVLWLTKRHSLRAFMGCLLLIVNLYHVVPYFLPLNHHPRSVQNENAKPTRTIRLLVFNVLRTNTEIEATLREAVGENADMLYLMEISPEWKPHLERLSVEYPHQKLICRNDYTGVAFLSKHAWSKMSVIDTGHANPPLEFEFPGADESNGYQLIATHPLPPFGSELTTARDEQLLQLAKRCDAKQPSLMVGDFNLTPWSPRFRGLLEVGGLRDASCGFGIRPTLAPLPTLFGGLKVDHVLVDGGVRVENFRLKASQHSDHKSIVLDFSVRE